MNLVFIEVNRNNMTIINYDQIPLIKINNAKLEMITKYNIDNYVNTNDLQKEIVYYYFFYENLKRYHNDTNLYYIFEFYDPNLLKDFDIKDFIPCNIIKMIINKKIRLIINNTGHGYHTIVNDLYKNIILEYNVDPNFIFLSSESYDMGNEITKIANHYKLPKIHYSWNTEFEKIVREQIDGIEFNKVKNIDKIFLNFNGRQTHHRTLLIFLLKSLNLLQYGYVSYNKNLYDHESALTYYMNIFKDNAELIKILKENQENILSIENMVLDNCNTQDKFKITSNNLYEKSLLSLVTETNFYGKSLYNENIDNGRILSEKTFKPIAMKHPFIIVSNKNFLDCIRSLGYKTFYPYIDESYDLIDDDAERLLAIVKEIERLTKMSKDEQEIFIKFTNDICEYNYQVLKNKKVFTRVIF